MIIVEQQQSLDLLPNIVWQANPHGSLISLNARWAEYTGMPVNQAVGQRWRSMVHAADLADYDAAFDRARNAGTVFDCELRLFSQVHRDYRSNLAKAVPIKDASGEVISWSGSFVEVHHLRNCIRELEARESQLRTMAANAPAVMWIAEPDGIPVFINDRWFNYTGISPATKFSSLWLSPVHPEDLKRCKEVWAEISKNLGIADMQIRIKSRQNETYEWWHLHITPLIEREIHTGWVGTIVNVESQKQTETMMQLVMDTIPQCIWWKDRDSRFLGCNKTFLTNAGMNELVDIIGKSDYEMPWRKEESDFFRACDKRVMDSDTPEYHIIEPKRMADGKQAWLDTSKIPLHDAEGKVVGTLGMYEDITERVKLVQQREDYMASLAHDLKVPIVGATRALEVILNGALGQISEEQRDFISKLHESHQHLLQLIQNILQVLRYEAAANELIIEEIDLNKLVNSSIRDLEPLIAKKDQTITSDQSVVTLHADSNCLKRVFHNLIGNATKFTHEGGKIHVQVRSEADTAIITISDNGVGIAKEDQSKLFQRFWQGGTVHKYSAEVGLGLYLCRQIVEAHGGRIYCESEIEKGTAFIIKLPITGPELNQLNQRTLKDLPIYIDTGPY